MGIKAQSSRMIAENADNDPFSQLLFGVERMMYKSASHVDTIGRIFEVFFRVDESKGDFYLDDELKTHRIFIYSNDYSKLQKLSIDLHDYFHNLGYTYIYTKNNDEDNSIYFRLTW